MIYAIASLTRSIKGIVTAYKKSLTLSFSNKTLELSVATKKSVKILYSNIAVKVIPGPFILARKLISDAYNIADAAYKLVFKNAEEQVNLSDTFNRVVQYNPSLSDTSSISDTFDRTVVYTRSLTDSFNVTDDINGAAIDDDENADYFKVTSDAASIGEVVTSTTSKSLADTSNILESLNTITAKNTSDSSTISESLASLLNKVSSDISNIAESLANSVDQVTGDIFNIASSGVVANQDYAADYFFSDYVGESRSIT